MLGRKVINQSLIYGLASLLINGSNFFLIPLYTHYLTPIEYGILSSVTVVSALATAVLTMGLNGAVTRLYFDYPTDEFRKFLFSVFLFQIITALAIVVVLLMSGGLFLNMIYSNVSYDPYLKYGLIIGFTGIFGSIPLAFLQAQSKALLYRLFTSTSFIILTIFMVIFIVVLEKGSLGGIKATMIASSIMALAYTVFIIRESQFHFDFSFVWRALYFSLPLMVYVIFGTITEISSKYFIERYISLSHLGIFNVAQQIAAVITLLTNAINMAWIPVFYSEARKDERSTLFSLFANFFIAALVLGGLTLSVFSPEIVSLFMAADYKEASRYIPYLIFAYVIGNGYWLLLINPLTFSKKTIFLPLLTIISGILSVGLNIFLIPLLGLFGAAISSCLSYFFLVLIAYFIFKKHSFVQYNFRTINSIVLAGVLIYILSNHVSLDQFWINLTIKFGLIGLFLILLHYLKIYSLKEVKLFFKSPSNQQ